MNRLVQFDRVESIQPARLHRHGHPAHIQDIRWGVPPLRTFQDRALHEFALRLKTGGLRNSSTS